MITRILEWLGYNYNSQNIRKKGVYNLDYVLCLVYAGVSLINTFMGINNLHFTIGANGKRDINTITTVLLIIVNAIELFRLNIKLYIQNSLMEERLLSEMANECQKIVKAVHIKPLDKRLAWLRGCYIIDAVILILNCVFIKNGIGTSLCILIILPIILIFINNAIDISIGKYNAKEKITCEIPYELILKKGNK